MNKRAHRRILAECLRCLSVNGVTVDDALEDLIGYFFFTDSHLSAGDLEAYARERRLGMGRPEIEQTLRLLVDYGFAVRKDFDENRVVYEHLHLGEHHDHFYCVRCGAITEFLSREIEELQAAQARAHGFHAFTHRMQIHGLCASCFGEAAQTVQPLSVFKRGATFRVVEIAGAGKGHGKRRFGEMGLVPDAQGEVITNTLGALVVSVGGNRLALGRGQAAQVMAVLTN